MTDFYADLLSKMKRSVSENAEGELLEMISFFSGRPFEEIRKLKLESKFDGSVWGSVLTGEAFEKILAAVEKRCAGTPVQYLTNRAFFFGREFYVDERVLIPRFDTETLVETALPFISSDSKVLDLCCGSGCIGLTLCLQKNCAVTLADISEGALRVAEKNAKDLGVERANFVCHDVFSDGIDGVFDVLVCNPPYISKEEMRTLDREVLCEPRSALEAEDGYPFYRIVPKKYFENLKNGGILIFEVGKGQARTVSEICSSCGYENVFTAKDLNNIERVVCARKPLETDL